MVENCEGERPGPRQADWPALYERWRCGEAPEALAERHNLALSTVLTRCRWADRMFPPDAAPRLRQLIAVHVGHAETALANGDPVKAERWARALTALIRAVQALDAWSKPAVDETAEEDGGEQVERGRELARRLIARYDEQRSDGVVAEPAP